MSGGVHTNKQLIKIRIKSGIKGVTTRTHTENTVYTCQ